MYILYYIMQNKLNNTTVYTHNLKLLFFDDSFNLVNDDEEMDRVKDILCKESQLLLKINGNFEKVPLKWDKKEIGDTDKYFMGDLFTNYIYNIDTIIVTHTKQMLIDIQSKYNVKFHISRLLIERNMIKSS